MKSNSSKRNVVGTSGHSVSECGVCERPTWEAHRRSDRTGPIYRFAMGRNKSYAKPVKAKPVEEPKAEEKEPKKRKKRTKETV